VSSRAARATPTARAAVCTRAMFKPLLDGGKSPRIRISPFVAVETCEAVIFRNAHSIEFEVPSEEAVIANLVNYAQSCLQGKCLAV
jgi:hypothetical protein